LNLPRPPPAQPFFLDTVSGPAGYRFCLYHTPAVDEGLDAVGAVLYLHPFAEEMNKSRRMAALQSRALAASGYAVLQIDLHGCGDSSGDFGEASWDHWLDDAVLGAQWLSRRHAAPLWLWGLRTGCLVACEAATRIDKPIRVLFWQPPASGKVLLRQFLRLKLAGQLLEREASGAVESTWDALSKGHHVEVAGYTLAPELAIGLDRARLHAPRNGTDGHWLEVSTRPAAELLPATTSAAASWRDAGIGITTTAATGPAFWQTQEIEDAPALIDATIAALAGKRQAA